MRVFFGGDIKINIPNSKFHPPYTAPLSALFVLHTYAVRPVRPVPVGVWCCILCIVASRASIFGVVFVACGCLLGCMYGVVYVCIVYGI